MKSTTQKKTKESENYYNQFIYRVEKKITVEDHKKIKDYAKKRIYLYIIHDPKDDNRFLFLSSRHFEEETKVYPHTFKFEQIAGTNESIHLKIKKSKFGIPFFRLLKEKGDFSIIFSEIIKGKTKDNKFFKKYKTHTKKIALDNPDWYLEHIMTNDCKSFKKKLLKLLLCNNKYNEEIIQHSISTFFILNNPDFQKFNDHNVVLDEGKTGKSSLIGYMGEKLDNISVAGLYGSSDSKRGKFKGGIITTTEKSILIDEMNELIKNNKGDKILSVLNSLLENGTYNYQKQFGQKIRSANQFFFMGNIGSELNFPMFLLGSFGNVETLGRRIGIVTFNNNLAGYEMGLIRPEKADPFLDAMSLLMSNIFNSILQDKKFIEKLYSHKKYRQLSQFYKGELIKIANKIEDETARQFIRSHCSTIDRVVCRGLKLWIFNNLDDFVNGKKEYNSHSIFEILDETEKHLKKNILNFQNIQEHTQEYTMSSKKEDMNKIEFEKLTKTEQSLLKFFWINKAQIDIKGVEHHILKYPDLVKKLVYDYKRRGIPSKHTVFLQQYGANISQHNQEFRFRIINQPLLESRLKGIFKEISAPQESKSEKIENAWNKDKKQEEKQEVEIETELI